MQNTGKTVCPICAEENPVAAILCKHCGYRLRLVRLAISRANADSYQIVPDGEGFAISFRGEVKVDGLELADLGKAQSIIAILNSVVDEIEEVDFLTIVKNPTEDCSG